MFSYPLTVRIHCNWLTDYTIDHSSIEQNSLAIEFFLNNTNLTFLAFLYKIDNEGFQNQQKIKLPPAGIELTRPTIYGLEF